MVNMTKAVELARMCYNSDIGPCPVPFDCCCTDVTPQHWEEILNNEQVYYDKLDASLLYCVS